MARPPPIAPSPPHDPQATGTPAPTPPEAEEVVSPPPGRTAAPGREAAPTRQPPAPAGTTMDQRIRANTPGRQTDRARRQQASTYRSGMGVTPSMARVTSRTLALSPAQGRQRDGLRQGDPKPQWPPSPRRLGERHTGRPPPPPTPPPALQRPRCAGPPHGEHTARSQVGGKRDRPPSPQKTNQTEHRTGAGSAEGHGPSGTALPAPSTGTARGARATPTRGGGGGADAAGVRAHAHTHKGHVGNTRMATGPSPRNAQTA